MPRFFFDTHDGEQFLQDQTGLELEDLQAAKAAAQASLADLARDVLPNGDQATFIVSVRDEAGQVVVRTALSLVSEYPTQPAASTP